MKHTISPSLLSYQFGECERCFWLAANGHRQEGPNLPRIFNAIDKAQKEGVTIEHVRALGIPAAQWLPITRVQSAPATFGPEGRTAELLVRGETDRLFLCEDDTVGVLDFKTAEPTGRSRAQLARQMGAYLYAIEHDPEKPRQVSQLWLVYFQPHTFKVSPDCNGYLTGKLTAESVPIDRPTFERDVLGRVAEILSRPLPPDINPKCGTCKQLLTTAHYLLERAYKNPTDN